MNNEQLFDLCRQGVRTAKENNADEVEVTAAFASGSDLSFEKNDINVAVSDEDVSFGVRVIVSGSVGFSTSNDPETIAETVEDALSIARCSIPNEFNKLPDPREISRVSDLFSREVAEMDVSDITEIGVEILQRVRDQDSRASVDSGSVGFSESHRVITSSTGIEASESTTVIGGDIFGMAVDGDQVGSFCYDGHYCRAPGGFREAILERVDDFVAKAIGALNPGQGESYRGPVLFSPEAVASLLIGNLLAMTGSPQIRKGKTPLAGRVGEMITSPLLSIQDNGTLPGGIGSSSFDREGLPHQPSNLVWKGRFDTVLYNHYEALAAGGGGSTGHANGGVGNLPGVGPTRLEVLPGTTNLRDIESGAGRCVLVTRFSGNTNPVTGEFSGVVKAGHLIKDGEHRPISETLISGNLLEAFNNISAISTETKTLYGQSVMPWILVDDISVTAG